MSIMTAYLLNKAILANPRVKNLSVVPIVVVPHLDGRDHYSRRLSGNIHVRIYTQTDYYGHLAHALRVN